VRSVASSIPPCSMSRWSSLVAASGHPPRRSTPAVASATMRRPQSR
jgi:hypothetical protein